ncbi:MAG: hypothetical protein AAFY56_16160 [Pseudomonadota bacterium]
MLRFMLSTFHMFKGYFWLASPVGFGNPRVLDIQRAFGRWSISRQDIVSRSDAYAEDGEKLYSDIAVVNDSNLEHLAEISDRNLFGIDSGLFFLPTGVSLPLTGIVDPLTQLLIKRNSLGVIDNGLRNHGLIEEFVSNVTTLDGVPTIVLRDSNMSTFLLAFGSEFVLNQAVRSNKNRSPDIEWKHVADERHFLSLLDVGVDVSVFS